jgi:hypothetical protein
MPVIETSLFSVIRRFPDLKKAAKRLFMESEPFRTMCEDFQRCSEALRHWEQSTSEEAPVRRKEYALLRRDLEREILENLPNPDKCVVFQLHVRPTKQVQRPF